MIKNTQAIRQQKRFLGLALKRVRFTNCSFKTQNVQQITLFSLFGFCYYYKGHVTPHSMYQSISNDPKSLKSSHFCLD